VVETVDDAVGRVYTSPTAEGLLEAIDNWEEAGDPHDPQLARRRAEGLALPVFRERLLGYLAEVVAGATVGTVPPTPHLIVPPEADRSRARAS
jgi:hypothetical protein